jgi:hypothetical protein
MWETLSAHVRKETRLGVLCVTCFLLAEEATHGKEDNMRYCLSEEEYNKLMIERIKIGDASREKLQRVCMLVANFVPVPPNNEPWNCYLDGEGKPMKEMADHYCDGCPVSKECPYDGKKFGEGPNTKD